MAKLSFPIKDVKKLVDVMKESKEFVPDYNKIYDSNLPIKKGVKKRNEDELPYKFDEIDFEKIKPCFHLVKDQGVYLLSNAKQKKEEKNPMESGLIAFAKGYNPSLDEDWYDKAHYELGGDDFVVSIPLEWYDILIERKPGARVFAINLGANEISLIE